MNKNLILLHQIASELRKSASKPLVKNNMIMEYIVKQTRAHKETSEVYCKAKDELNNLGQNYLCYLNSLNKYHEINKYYSGKGERSVKETANLVGFKLPHDP